MAKSKKTKRNTDSKKAEKNTNDQTKAAKYVSHLLELHKLQGALLTRLNKEVK